MNEESLSLSLSNCGQITVSKNKVDGYLHPISRKLWGALIALHQKLAQTTKDESVSYHRWNPVTQEYDTIFPYQEGVGLSVTTDWQDPRNKALLDDYGKKWGVEFMPACTIHTHVDIAAFESGTDFADEEHQSGWHITLGRLCTGKVIDVSSRFRLPKVPPVTALTDTKNAYKLPLAHLFEEGTDLNELIQPDLSYDPSVFNIDELIKRHNPEGRVRWKGYKKELQEELYWGNKHKNDRSQKSYQR